MFERSRREGELSFPVPCLRLMNFAGNNLSGLPSEVTSRADIFTLVMTENPLEWWEPRTLPILNSEDLTAQQLKILVEQISEAIRRFLPERYGLNEPK